MRATANAALHVWFSLCSLMATPAAAPFLHFRDPTDPDYHKRIRPPVSLHQVRGPLRPLAVAAAAATGNAVAVSGTPPLTDKVAAAAGPSGGRPPLHPAPPTQ